jgi:hypothetical protein
MAFDISERTAGIALQPVFAIILHLRRRSPSMRTLYSATPGSLESALPGAPCRGIIEPSPDLETFMRIPASLCAFALVAVTALPLAAAAQTTMKINISVAQNSHYGVAIDTFAREVEARTNGRYRIQTFYAGALGAERESVEACSSARSI